MAFNRMSAALSVLISRNFSKIFLRARRTLKFSHSLGHERTSRDVRTTSGLPSTADTGWCIHVGIWLIVCQSTPYPSLASPLLLSRIHGLVGRIDHLLGRRADRQRHQAGAAADRKPRLAMGDAHRLDQLFQFARLGRRQRGPEIPQQHAEFVAGGVAVLVVDRLEAVEID